MKKLLLAASAAVLLFTACGERPLMENCTSNCTIQAPPMSQDEILYHQRQHDLADDILEAMIIQSIFYYHTNPYGSSYGRYVNMSPAQQQTIIQKNVTVINNNKTVVQKVQKSEPATVKTTAPKPATKPATTPKTTAPVSKPTGGGRAGGSSFSSSRSSGRSR